jgi:hypothetical protein
MNANTKLAMALLALSAALPAQADGVDAAGAHGAQPLGQACSEPPFTEQYVSTGSAQWTTNVHGCGLDSALSSGLSAAAVAHYARRPDLGFDPLRMRFTVDLSALTGLNFTQAVQLAAGVAAASAPLGAEGTARLLQVSVLGSPGGPPTLAFSAACAGQPNNRCTALSPLATLQPFIGLEWRSGGVGTGQLRWWIDADFDQTPTGSLPLDNVPWGALERVVLGLASPTPGFMAGQAGRTVRFGRIEVLEDQLAWYDFEPLEIGLCGFDPAPPLVIGAGGTAFGPGTTCGGTWGLTTLASGSTEALTPERNYRVQITGVGVDQSPRPLSMQVGAGSDPGIHAFLCERACGPSARCHLVAAGQPAFGELEPGEYRLVLKSLSNQVGHCGNFNVVFSSVLK